MITLDSSNSLIGHIIDVNVQIVSAEAIAEHKNSMLSVHSLL
jgi:hypothetical protein